MLVLAAGTGCMVSMLVALLPLLRMMGWGKWAPRPADAPRLAGALGDGGNPAPYRVKIRLGVADI